MQKDKVESLLGFAVKAGKVLYGIDTLQSAKAKYYAIVLCNSAAENTRKRVTETAEKKHVPIVLSEKELQYAVSKKNCKVLAVTDRQMADAILQRLGENYHLISSEGK